MNICTIVATNYVAHARVLAASFARHHPHGTCHVLVIDDVDGVVDEADEPFAVVRPSDLDLGAAAFAEMCGVYDVVELATALKPWLLRHMLRTACRDAGVVYLDPDIRVESAMTEVQDALATHSIVLTPHLTVPLPRDGRTPSEIDILQSGVYNLGFIGLACSPEAEELLRWWCERLRTDCRVDIQHGLFVDQRWIDFVPGFHARLFVLRLPNYNVAYWNLPTRELTNGGGRLSVDGRPLRFFHFSGYSPLAPRVLSRHQNRIGLASEPVLRAVCDDYRSELLHAGFEAVRLRPYAYDTLPGGLPIDATMRRLYRAAVESRELGEPVFSERGGAEFLDWLNEPVGGATSLTRYLHGLWEGRPDLKATFPEVSAGDPERYLSWCVHHGQPRIADQLLPARSPAAPSAPAVAVPAAETHARRAFGANVVGYLRSELGVGEVARQLVGALDAASVPCMPIVRTAPLSRQGHGYAAATSAAGPFGINLVCVNADAFPLFAREAGPEFFAGRYTIGFWWWEVDAFPEALRESFELVDEVWVGSRFVAETLAKDSPVPVVHVPVPIELESPEPLRPGELGWPDAFTVMFSWDYNSVFERKNPLAAIEAYCSAFAPHDGAVLVLKCINHEHAPDHHAQVRTAAATRPDIVVMDGYVSARDRNRLVASCDCYLSLHRSEGLGLTMLEAMHFGVPVVATGYSGSADFLSRRTGFPVDYELVPIGPGAEPYPPDALWAEPDVGHAARLLRHVFEHRDDAARVAARGRDRVAQWYAPAAVGRVMQRRLREIDRLHVPSAPVEPRPSTPDDDALAKLLEWRGRPRYPSRFGWPGALARRAMLRLIRPYTSYQVDVNDALLAALARAESRTQNVGRTAEQRLAETHAGLLRELRRAPAPDVVKAPEPLPVQHHGNGRAHRPPGQRLLVLADVGGPAFHVGDEATLEANLRRVAASAPEAHVAVIGRSAGAGEIAAELEAADGMLISGGGNLSSSWPALLEQRIEAMRQAAQLGVPVVTGGQTIGPHLSDADRVALREALGTVACLGVRDVPSAVLASELGVPRERIFYQVDDAFLLGGSPPARESLLQAAAEPFLAVTLDASFAASSARPVLERIGSQLAAAAAEAELRVLLIPHVGPRDAVGQEDGAVAQLLREPLAGVGCTLVPVLPPAEAVWLAQQAAAVVSSRLHPIVFALAGAVPCLALHRDRYTQIKLEGALSHAGMQVWSMSAGAAEAGGLAPAFRDLWGHRAQLRDAMLRTRAAIDGREARRWHHVLTRAGIAPANGKPTGPAPFGWPEQETAWAAGLETRAPLSPPPGARTTKGTSMLTDEQWDRFSRDGYLHLGPVLDSDAVDALRRRADDLALGRVRNEHVLMQLDTGGAYEALPDAVPAFEQGTLRYRKIQGLERDELFRPLVVDPLFLAICARMYGPHAPVSIFRAMIMNKPAGMGTTLPWHQDGGGVWKLDRDPLVTIWVALDDATVANGCMEAVRGSHLKGLLTAQGSTLSDEAAAIHCHPDRVVPLEVKAGHAVLLHNWLIHRSGVNPSSASRRAFTGCYMDGRTISVLTGSHFPLVSGSVGEYPYPFVAQLETDSTGALERFRAAEEYARSLEAELAQLREHNAEAQAYAKSLETRLEQVELDRGAAEEYAQSLAAEREQAPAEGPRFVHRAAERLRSGRRS